MEKIIKNCIDKTASQLNSTPDKIITLLEKHTNYLDVRAKYYFVPFEEFIKELLDRKFVGGFQIKKEDKNTLFKSFITSYQWIIKKAFFGVIVNTFEFENTASKNFPILTDNTSIEESVYISITSEVDNFLVKNGIVYEWENKESYIKLVRNKSRISHNEKSISKGIKTSKSERHSIVYRNTEFPINEKGLYVL